MIFILEGPECAGKTTLAKQLSEQTGFPIVHRKKPENEEERQQMMRMYIEAINNSDNVIFDRCWYSEMVYGDIMRDKSYINIDQMYMLEHMLARKGGIVIHCTDDVLKLWDRCQERGEDYVTDIDTLDAIRGMFEYIMHYTAHLVPVVKYVVNDKGMQ